MQNRRYVDVPTPEVSSDINKKVGSWTGDSSLSMDETNRDFRLLNITLHFSSAVTNDATISLDSKEGMNYDTSLVTFDNSSGISHNYASFGHGAKFEAGDVIRVSCDVGADTAYCIIRYELT